MSPGSVVVITGISAAGKSAVAEALAARFERGVHVRGDIFRKMVVAGRAEMAPDALPEAERQLRLRYELAAATADRYAAAGFAVVWQDVILGPFVAEAANMLRTRHRYLVVLVPRPAVVAEREAARPKTAYRTGSYTIEDLNEVLVRDTPRLGLWLDSSDLDVDETVDAILARADRARLRRLPARARRRGSL